MGTSLTATLLALLLSGPLAYGRDHELRIHLTSGEVVAVPHHSIRRIHFSPLANPVDEPRAGAASFLLLPNHPNPFNPSTTVEWRVAVEGDVRLTVRDLRGARVRTLHEGRLPAGDHRRVWDGHDGQGVAVASGVYLAVLEGGGRLATRKMLLVK